MPCIYLIHRDPSPSPTQIVQSQPLPADPRPSSRVEVPFGAGSRHRIGNHLALLTIKTRASDGARLRRAEADPEPSRSSATT